MSAPGILIVGAGQGGAQVAVSLREEGYEGRVTLVGSEEWTPYQRPPLSKGYLAGDLDEQDLLLREDGFYVERGITVITGEPIVDVTLQSDGGTAIGASGTRYPFDQLALAPGAVPRRLAVEGAELDGVLYLRDIADARELVARWDVAQHVVVVGGGFIGLEIAAAARQAGKIVTVLEATSRLIGRAVSEETSAFYLRAHRDRGIDVRLGVRLDRLEGEGGAVRAVRLDDGEAIPADLVLIGIGAVPRSELAERLGLTLLQGAIVVDEFARTSEPRVVAVGDAVVQPHPLGAGSSVRLESVQNAVDLARTAARTLVGRNVPHRAVPWFWSDQADLKLQIAGLSTDADRVVLREHSRPDAFTALYYTGDRIVGVDAVNAPADYMAVRRALTEGANIPADLAVHAGTPLRSLITTTVAGSKE